MLLFELLDSRAMLLLFPNTFEFFFIVYEVIRAALRALARSAAPLARDRGGLWVFVKLPRSTGSISRSATSPRPCRTTRGSASLCALFVLALVAVFAVRRPAAAARARRGWRIAADPLPASLADAHARHAHRLHRGGVLWAELAEKVALLG